MFDLEFARTLQVVFGIGLVIFVHEFGHYLAARWCGVRVETFSLGFGPRLLGARIGQTYYQIALVPLGGFCRMAGDERSYDMPPKAPDELRAKSVGARFFIYSGGVLMNMLFGLVVFPILFQIGVPFTRPIIGELEPGGSAWRARLPRGHEIVSVNGSEVFEFEQLPTEVALGDPRHATLVLRDPSTGAERNYELEPERDDAEGLSTVGAHPDLERDSEGLPLIRVRADSPATRAGLCDGDRLVTIAGAVPGLSPGSQLTLLMTRGQTLELEVKGSSGPVRSVRVQPELTAQLQPPRFGISPPVNRVRAVRPSEGPALALEPGDRLLSVNGKPLIATGDLQRALLSTLDPVTARVRRGGRELELVGPALDRAQALAVADDVAPA